MVNRDPVITGTGFIGPEGSIPITRCSTTYEQGSIIIDRIELVSINDRAFNRLVLVIHNNNISGD
jgi:hypothetical protein